MIESGEWHDLIQCCVLDLRYDFPLKIGHLYLRDGECVDMSGCIKLFEGISNKVHTIHTYAGGKHDTTFVRDSTHKTKWYPIIKRNRRKKKITRSVYATNESC